MDKLTFLHYTSLLREINSFKPTSSCLFVKLFSSRYLRRLSLIKSSAFINIFGIPYII